MIQDALTSLGLELKVLVAGFLGGLANVFFMKKVAAWQAVGSVFIGTVTAGYLTPIAIRVFGFDLGGGASFVIGLCAMAICQGLFSIANRWSGDNNGNS